MFYMSTYVKYFETYKQSNINLAKIFKKLKCHCQMLKKIICNSITLIVLPFCNIKKLFVFITHYKLFLSITNLYLDLLCSLDFDLFRSLDLLRSLELDLLRFLDLEFLLRSLDLGLFLSLDLFLLLDLLCLCSLELDLFLLLDLKVWIFILLQFLK